VVIAHRTMAGRDRGTLDWRALTVVILFHAAVVLWFVGSHWGEPIRARLADMVLVELWEPPLVADRLPKQASATVTAAAQRAARQTRQNVAALPRAASHGQPDRRLIVPEGQDVVSVAVESSSPSAASVTAAASLAGAGSQASLSTHGDGSYSGPRFRPPRVQRRFTPDYPLDALRAHKEGSVDVMVTVAADGHPIESHLYQSSGTPSLDSAAVAAAMAYKYRGAERNGNAIEAQAIVTIDWQIGPNTVEHVAIASPKPTTPDREAVMKQLDCLGDPLLLKHVELCKRKQDH
jgi:TonB family protein